MYAKVSFSSVNHEAYIILYYQNSEISSNMMRNGMNKRALVILGSLMALALTGIVFLAQISITPTDTKIINILEENRRNLLGIVGVVGAGIARDENNRTMGIAVYVDDAIISTQEIPSKMGEFRVYIKDIDEASDFEKEKMLIRNTHYHLLKVTTDKEIYQQNETIIITIGNLSNENFTFSNSVYGIFFERWNGDSWEFYTGVVGLQVITYLKPKEEGKITYHLGGEAERPFPSGKYRVISKGWLEHNKENINVWGYAEFIVQ